MDRIRRERVPSPGPLKRDRLLLWVDFCVKVLHNLNIQTITVDIRQGGHNELFQGA